MLNFEEELKRFKPSMDAGDVETSIKHQDMTDVIDLLREAETRRIGKEVRGKEQQGMPNAEGRARQLSWLYYNQGLEQAAARDLSGATTKLRQSLQLNKRNIQARNLLGLIYYETGEVIAASSSNVQ